MMKLLCNETFKEKELDEAMEYLNLLTENAWNWNIIGTYEALRKT